MPFCGVFDGHRFFLSFFSIRAPTSDATDRFQWQKRGGSAILRSQDVVVKANLILAIFGRAGGARRSSSRSAAIQVGVEPNRHLVVRRG